MSKGEIIFFGLVKWLTAKFNVFLTCHYGAIVNIHWIVLNRIRIYRADFAYYVVLETHSDTILDKERG